MPSLDQLLPLLAAEPTDPFLRYAVAMEYAKLNRHDDALNEFNQLLQHAPDYVPGYFMAGRTCEQKGDLEAARTFYKNGIAAANRTGDSHAAGEISSALMAIE